MPARLAALVLSLLPAAAPGPEGKEAPPRQDRRDLLLLREGEGKERRVAGEADWRARRALILRAMEEVMGPFPLRPAAGSREPPRCTVEEEVQAAGHLRRRIRYDSEGDPVPAYLLLPLGRKGRAPAVLCLHQTTSLGKGEPAGLGGKESLHYAAHLAARGFVTLAPDYPNFGDHLFDAYGRGFQSGSMKAIQDNVRAVDLLRSLPEVDPERIGCLGHSLGGHNALFTAVFDERLRAVVSNCGFTAFEHYYRGDLAGWSSKTYMPRIPSYGGWKGMPFDFHEVVAALAPRPFLALAPLHDSNFEVEGVREVVESARAVYRLLGAEERLEAHYPDCGHDFPPASREQAYRWLERWLSPAGEGGAGRSSAAGGVVGGEDRAEEGGRSRS